MPFYRSNCSSDDSEFDAIVINRSPTERVRSQPAIRPRREGLTFGFKFSDLFRSRPRKTRVVRIIQETPPRRRSPERTREVRFRDASPSPPPTRSSHRRRVMTEEEQVDGFTPLPPKIKKSSSSDSGDYDIEDRAPRRRPSKSSKKSQHKRKDSKMEHEFIEPASPRRLINESDAERARRKQAERERAEAINVATQHADLAYAERVRREEVESLGRSFERAYIDEREVRLDAVREAEDAKARAEDLAKALEREKREKKYLERKAEILGREKRVAEETERLNRAAPRPVSLHQDDLPPLPRDRGADAIRRAQEDARRRQRNMEEDDSLFGNQRARGRRGSVTIFDDDNDSKTSFVDSGLGH